MGPPLPRRHRREDRVATAYERLAAESYLSARVGAGTPSPRSGPVPHTGSRRPIRYPRAVAGSPGRCRSVPGGRRLRTAVARYLGIARSAQVTADDMVVTNGTQHALDLIARVLLRPGDYGSDEGM